MTLDELTARWKRSYRTIQQERFMRMKVFAELADVEAMKNELKRLLGGDDLPAQAILLDVPARREEHR